MAACSGVICLSWAVFDRERRKRRAHHLDGGVSRVPIGEEPRFDPGSILYTGALSEYGGTTLLVEAFHRIKDPSAKLWVCGKGHSSAIDRAKARDMRIAVFGVVAESRLAELTSAAAVLANPRPPALQASEDNFPSKVLEYLSYGKPVVSTWTPGLGPGYRDVLLVAESGSVEHYANALRAALALGPDDRARMRARIRRYLDSEKLWSVQAARLIEWVREGIRA